MGNPPSVTYPSPNEFPVTTLPILNIQNGLITTIIAPNQPFTAADINVTTVMILHVQGMLPINGQTGVIQGIIDTNTFTVNINSLTYPYYTGGGIVSIVTGEPPVTVTGFQVYNTPFENIL